MNQYSLIKRIAKHGKQAIIVIPKLLQDELSPGTVVEIKVSVIKERKND